MNLKETFRYFPVVFLVAGLLTLTGAQAFGSDQPAFPSPLGYVSDYAGVVEADWKGRIRSVCRDLERKTGVEMIVVTTSSIEPFRTLNDYAGALYKRWRIGTAQDEHGILVVALVGRPEISVTLGRNMIPVIPPAFIQEITEQHVKPTLKLGKYGEGLYRTTVALASASQQVRASEVARGHKGAAGFWLMIAVVVVIVTLFWLISRPDKRHPYRRVQRGEFWGTGRGGFGGNFGGFGGSTSGEGFS